MSKTQQKDKSSTDAIIRRLDALIRLLIELNKPKSERKFSEAEAARILKSVELTPTEKICY
jgi:hypothetical protein